MLMAIAPEVPPCRALVMTAWKEGEGGRRGGSEEDMVDRKRRRRGLGMWRITGAVRTLAETSRDLSTTLNFDFWRSLDCALKKDSSCRPPLLMSFFRCCRVDSTRKRKGGGKRKHLASSASASSSLFCCCIFLAPAPARYCNGRGGRKEGGVLNVLLY